MEKGKSLAKLTSSIENLQLESAPENTPSYSVKAYACGNVKTQARGKSFLEKVKPRSLVGLCLGVLGLHFEDIIGDLSEIASLFPADIKMAMTAIARRRNLLNDKVLVTLADSSWDILDVSGSSVTDVGLSKVVERCNNNLLAIDISRCGKITELGVLEVLRCCSSLTTLRWGGCLRSDIIARCCLSMLKPKLNDVEGESWEELDGIDIADGSHSLCWLVWPTIDDYSRQTLATECPRIKVNPKPPSPFGFRGGQVPPEAFSDIAMDDYVVKDIDPKTWVIGKITPSTRNLGENKSSVDDLPMAERFRLAFVERDVRLAPKRAKNARQHKRRAEREWLVSSTDAKSIALAARASKILHKWN